jgi:hypothetical protein
MAATPDRWRRIEALFHPALERDPAVREAVLDGACGSDDGLRREVQLMLAEASSSHQLLEKRVSGLLAKLAVTQGDATGLNTVVLKTGALLEFGLALMEAAPTIRPR